RVRQAVAIAQARLGHLPEAIKELEGIDQRAWSADTVVALASYYLRANRPAEAARLLSPVVGRSPGFVSGRYLLALAYLQSNDPKAAVAHLEELQRRETETPTRRFRLGVAYSRMGRAREALDQFDPLAKSLGKIAEYQVERGRALMVAGGLDEALAAAKAAERLAPQSPQVYLLMGQIKTQRRGAKAARAMFAEACAVVAGVVTD